METALQKVTNNRNQLIKKLIQVNGIILNQQNSSSAKNDITANNSKPSQTEIENETTRLNGLNKQLKTELNDLVKQLTKMQISINDIASFSSFKQNSIDTQQKNKLNVAKSQKNNDTSLTKVPKNNNENVNQVKKEKNKPAQKAKENVNPKSAPKPKGKNEPVEADRTIDASRLDLRVGRIVDVKKHPEADSLYIEQIDCGEEKPRTVVSGLVKFVPQEEMQNRLVVILCNLKPAKIRGIVSEAMVMCASTPEKVEILSPPETAVPGDRVTFSKYPGTPDTQLNPKKKIWEQIAPDLATNDSLEANYKGDPFVIVDKGVVRSQTLKNVIVK